MPNDPYQILNPQLAADQIALQRRMAFADALRKQSMENMGDTQFIGGRAIVRSPMEGFAKLFQGYQAGEMDKANDNSRADMAKKQAAALDSIFGNTSNVSNPAVGAAATNVVPYLNGTANQDTLPDMSGYRQAQAQMPQQQNRGMSLTGDPGRDRMIAGLIGPDKYMELYAKNYEPTNEMRNFNAPGQFGQLMQTKLANDATMKMDQGATYRTPNGQERYMPKLPEGMVSNNGVAAPMPGFIPSNNAIQGGQAGATAGATAAAQAPYKFSDVVQPDGTTLKVSDAQIRAATSKGGMPIESAEQHAAKVAEGTAAGSALAKAKSDLPVTIANADEAIKQIDEMVGSADKKIPTHPGFNNYVGSTWKPGMRFVEGSPEASFQAREEQIKGGVFLKAYQDLKGAGQITEIEGAKAESALNRMKKSISKEEYISAARDYQDALRKGVQRAKEQAGQPSLQPATHPKYPGFSIAR